MQVSFKNLVFIATLLFFSSCGETPEEKKMPFNSKTDYEETIIASHQLYLKKEAKKIQDFIDSIGMPFIKTGTGLRYHIYEQQQEGDSIYSGEVAVVDYFLSSLEGDTLYKTELSRLQEFAVDYEDIESGLHEGIKKMRVGEKAFLILPAHLGHGITGDQAAIPSQTTLVYNIHLVAKK